MIKERTIGSSLASLTGGAAKIAPEQIYTQPETAALLRVSERALEAWRHRKGGPRFVRLGGGKRGAIRYRGQALLDYLIAAERADTHDEGRGQPIPTP